MCDEQTSCIDPRLPGLERSRLLSNGVPVPRRVLRAGAGDLAPHLEALRAELGVPEAFPAGVEQAATAAQPIWPETDRTTLPLVSIDPAGSRDLDQALHLERRSGGGFRVWYAIADVAAWISPGDAVDIEANVRGVTLYSPDKRTPLHPPSLSEGRASLLAGQETPAVLWRIDLDEVGEVVDRAVERARVCNTAQLTYPEAQRLTDEGDERLGLLAELGPIRQARAKALGALRIQLPDQEVERTDAGYVLVYRAPLPVEDWNAELSLLTGQVAAELMLDSGRGVLRTLPDPTPATVDEVRRSARALGVPWPRGASPASVLGDLEPTTPATAALITQSARLLRGAGYEVLGSSDRSLTHAGVAAPYAHVTAPLRRLVDRYATEYALAAHDDRPVPDWVSAAEADLPSRMAEAGSRASVLERSVVDLVEAAVLAGSVGQKVHGEVVAQRRDGVVVQVVEPAVIAVVDTAADLGTPLELTVSGVDLSARSVSLEPV